MSGVSQVLKSSLSGELELGRILWAVGTLALIGYQGVAVLYNKQPFSPMEFGGGAAAILAAGGFGIAAKDKGVAAATARSSQDGIG